ncbi:class II Aldolase and Adducin domain-containing protein [Colletotrichum orchidophilum]|uniref:Class II Aldolase and Adducin domain-containing protein n=1 Tax=Colletotrichum orchidophilum TaxID=1209926 RepID=A0A1G4B0R5_9PEZI|nr:class II Aldolase and Adducin domain-containing protein [Colletotrichum orchidophilum]OHE94971.1 class II Aldolase and Adducin domain-containing protein [Colletotrichum orchidophilum]
MLERMAGAFRVIDRQVYIEGTAGHILIRDAVDPDNLCINPLARHFGLIKISDRVHVNIKGEVIGGKSACINNAGFEIHSEFHEARPDFNAACHETAFPYALMETSSRIPLLAGTAAASGIERHFCPDTEAEY